MLEPKVAQALLARAVAAFGAEKVAERLGTSPDAVRAWMYGHANMPERKGSELLDLMSEIEP